MTVLEKIWLARLWLGATIVAWPGARVLAECTRLDTSKLVTPECPIGDNLVNIYNQSIGILLWLVILMFIVAGYIYITSMGSQERVKLAKDILVTTLTGAVLLIMLPLILQALGQPIK